MYPTTAAHLHTQSVLLHPTNRGGYRGDGRMYKLYGRRSQTAVKQRERESSQINRDTAAVCIMREAN